MAGRLVSAARRETQSAARLAARWTIRWHSMPRRRACSARFCAGPKGAAPAALVAPSVSGSTRTQTGSSAINRSLGPKGSRTPKPLEVGPGQHQGRPRLARPLLGEALAALAAGERESHSGPLRQRPVEGVEGPARVLWRVAPGLKRGKPPRRPGIGPAATATFELVRDGDGWSYKPRNERRSRAGSASAARTPSLCWSWLANKAETKRLLGRCGDSKDVLMRLHTSLACRRRVRVPQVAPLGSIGAQLDQLDVHEGLATSLSRAGATKRAFELLKFQVAMAGPLVQDVSVI